jgi:hypothetical protein
LDLEALFFTYCSIFLLIPATYICDLLNPHEKGEKEHRRGAEAELEDQQWSPANPFDQKRGATGEQEVGDSHGECGQSGGLTLKRMRERL